MSEIQRQNCLKFLFFLWIAGFKPVEKKIVDGQLFVTWKLSL